ncbi:MAG TPA: insulinase family protein, partial [Thermoanaerobaculia bacterium]|nr:insulinase family protein [Thermoanaerobaculia bacterium]
TTLSVLRKLKTEGARPREVFRAKELLKGNILLSLESTVARMSAQARQEFYFGRAERPEEWLARIEAVTPEQVEDVTREVFSGDSLSLSIVGDVGRLDYTSRDLAAAVA